MANARYPAMIATGTSATRSSGPATRARRTRTIAAASTTRVASTSRSGRTTASTTPGWDAVTWRALAGQWVSHVAVHGEGTGNRSTTSAVGT